MSSGKHISVLGSTGGGLAVLSISSMDGGERRADTPWWGGGEGTVPCSPRGRSGGVGCTLAIVL